MPSRVVKIKPDGSLGPGWSSFATTLGICHEFPFVDASLVLAELGGSTAALRDCVAARYKSRIGQTGHVR